MDSTATIYSINDFPVDLIEGDDRRKEFVSDCERLGKRCGHSAMISTFLLYLLEQKIEDGKEPAPGTGGIPKIKNVGYWNTAKIVARFVEKGWMDFYLASEPPLADDKLLMLDIGGAIFISQSDCGTGMPAAMLFIKKVSKGLRQFVSSYWKEWIESSIYIPPEEIRETFAKIDRRFGNS